MAVYLKRSLGGLTLWTLVVVGLVLTFGAAFAPATGAPTTLDGLEDGLGPAVETRVLAG
jgi:hypothetical protein